MGESPFRTFAEKHDLDYVESVLPGGGSIGREGLGELAGGDLPGGLTGAVGDLAQEIRMKLIEDAGVRESVRAEHSPGTGSSSGTTRYFRDSRMVVTRVPESTAFLPYVTCRDAEVRGFADRMIGPGGLIPLVDHIEFESIELNRRYRIGAFKGSENRLRQLFAPSVIDWMASSAPEGLYFELFGGVLMLTVTGKAESVEQIEHACELAAHLVDVIRSESTEASAPDGTPEYSLAPQQVEYERKQAEILAAAAFTTPPADVKTAREQLEPLVGARNRGFLRRIFKSINEGEATTLALEALIRGYGERHGMTWERPASFTGRHVDLPLPLTPLQLLRGPMPGLGVEGDLFVVGSGALNFATDCYPGAAVPVSESPAVLQVTPRREEQPEGEPLVIGGFPILAGEGERRRSERSAGDGQVAAAIAEELGGSFQVVAHRCEPGKTLTPAMRDWLLAEDRAGKCMLQRAGSTLAVVSAPTPVDEWSVAMLDSFCESLVPLAA